MPLSRKLREMRKDVNGEIQTCNCPKCKKDHQSRIKWIGRGKPRIFCRECQRLIDSAGYEGWDPHKDYRPSRVNT